MSDEPETVAEAPVIEPVFAPAPAPEPTGAALTVWHWFNTRVAGRIPTTAPFGAAEAHVLDEIPALIASLEQKV